MYLWALEFLRRPTSPAVLVTPPAAALSIGAEMVAARAREFVADRTRELIGAPPQPVRLVIEIELVAPKSRE
jgi:hypothetical protein